MESQWRSSRLLCSLSRSWWWWWLTCPLPVQSVSSSTQTQLNRKLVSWVNGADSNSVNPPSDSGSFDGTVLLWDVPWAVTPLVGEGATFKSRNLSLGVGGVLLDESTLAVRGFSLVQQGSLNQIGIPFGAEGGYRKVQSVLSKLQTVTRFSRATNACKTIVIIVTLHEEITTESRFCILLSASSSLQSLVLNNMYKEMYVICLLYEQVFSLLYEDGSSLDTRHRMFKVLDTPLLCRPPFSLDSKSTEFKLSLLSHLTNHCVIWSC